MVWQHFDAGRDAHAEDIRLWEDDRGLAAAAFFEAPSVFELDLRPDLEGDAVLLTGVLAWVEERRRALGTVPADALPLAYTSLGTDTLSTSVMASDTVRIASLEAHGFTAMEQGGVRFARSLTMAIAEPSLPPGARLRHATDADVAERADLHRDAWSVWGPSQATVQAYSRLRAAPLYDQELDVVLELDGHLVSYCICWADEETGVGLFEPVGTRPAYTGRGLAQAVILAGLRRLRARGMHTARVDTATVNTRALALYPLCGFRVADTQHYYRRRVQEAMAR